MKFLTGDDTGLLKWIKVEAQKVERLGARRRGDGVQRLCWAGPEEDREAAVAVAYSSGALELRDACSGQVLSAAAAAPDVRSLQLSASFGALAVSADGTATVVAEWGRTPAADQSAAATARQFQLQGPVAHSCIDPCKPQRFAFGGLENDVKIYDLEKQEVTWTARNVRENYLCLRVPVKVSTLAWASQMPPGRSLVMCGTSDGKVRVYDVNTQRRPLFELQVGFGAGAGTGGYTGTMDDTKRPQNCSKVAQIRGGKSWGLFVGDTMGVLREYDLRNLSKTQAAQIPPGRKSHLKLAAKELPFRRGYRGIMGSIRDVDVHCNGDALVAVGLGRFAYCFSTRGKRMTSKVYLKQKLNCVLMSSEAQQVPKEDQEDEEEEDEEADDALVDSDQRSGGADEAPQDEDDEIAEGFSDDDGGEAAALEAAEARPTRKKGRKRKLSKGAKAKV
eukprot:TRINITY_DN246_c0_g1_i1.p1 TRINITY_DN246_c0_g1~~TRINITY_DN246_c0_g1_i1.p1  ORF type:complete len:447 (+),score=109.47 TRINITY_DN246_c0_g1_i1:213-1553(+)